MESTGGPWELDLLDSCETIGVLLGTEPGSSVRAARAPSPHMYVCMHATGLEWRSALSFHHVHSRG